MADFSLSALCVMTIADTSKKEGVTIFFFLETEFKNLGVSAGFVHLFVFQ